MRKPFNILMCVWLSLGALNAANGAAERVDAILERQVEAMGGRQAIEKVKTKVIKGKIAMPTTGVNSSWEMWAKATNKLWTSSELPGTGVTTEGFNGKVAWSKGPWGGVREKSGSELDLVKRHSDFYRDLRMKELYPDLVYKGTEQLDGDEVAVLVSPGAKERFSYSTKTGLMGRHEWEMEISGTNLRMDMRFFDFKPTDGLQYPRRFACHLRAGDQDMDFTIQLTEVRHNVPMEDAKFEMPGEVRK